MKIDASSANLRFDHTVLAQLIARRWKQERPYFTLNERPRGAWLQASWERQPGRTALELRWFRRAPCIASADRLAPARAAFRGASAIPVTKLRY